MNKDLKEKAIDIKGKKYVLVSDRILYFNETYLNGKIETEIIKYENKQVIMKATVTPDMKNPDRKFTGYSQAIEGEGYINKTSALENCETSCVGRCLAMMGIGVLDSVASVDEIKKADNTEKILQDKKEIMRQEATENIQHQLEQKRIEDGVHKPTTTPTLFPKVCSVCGKELKQIPAGVSKSTGKKYPAFWACPNKCKKQ